MEKMVKKLSMLLFVAAIFSFTACEKDNADDNSNDNTTTTTTTTTDESLKNTTWIYNASDPNAAEIINVKVAFGNLQYVSVNLCHQSFDIDMYSGPYTYSNGSGTMDVRTDPQNQVSATFSISGNKMTLNFKGDTYTLTKSES